MKTIFFLFLSTSIFCQNYDFVKNQVVNFNLKINVDTNYFYCYNNSGNQKDDFFKIKKFHGKLIDGISNLIDIPRNNILINGKINNAYISYDVFVNTVKSNTEYQSMKTALINYLENLYNFKLKISDGYHSYDSWKLVISDSTLLPKAKGNLSPNYNINNVSKELNLNNISFNEVQFLIQNLSGYYIEVDNYIGNIDLKIPMDAFQSIEKANVFFNKYGIKVLWDSKEGPMTFITFF
jgi:hypothetical protein